MSRIMVIGGDRALAEALEVHPPLSGCEIDVCDNGVAALLAHRRRSYDVVVTDPETSVREDLALVDELRRLRPALRAILLAPKAIQADVLDALRARVYACFTAPFEAAEIAGMVEHACQSGPWRDGIELTSGLPNWITVRVSSHLVTAERLTQFMKEYRSDVEEGVRDDLLVAFREMLVNAMEHGAGFDPEKSIEVSAAHTGRAIVYHFRDPGVGFDRDQIQHAAVANPEDAPLAHLEHRAARGLRPGGFGILIARKLVDEVVYNERGNEVLLIKYTD